MISLWSAQRAALESNFTSSQPPLWSFSRASQGTQINGGVLTTVGNNVARFEDTPASGYLNEPQGTNILVNSALSGAVVGVVGSGGALPTGWTVSSAAGLTTTVVTAGAYIDIRVSGMSTGTSYRIVPNAASNVITASTPYTDSVYTAVVAGSTANISALLVVNDTNAGFTSAAINTTATLTRASATNNSAATGGNPGLYLTVTLATTIDITIRLQYWQWENFAFSTSWVSTITAQATRASDNLTLDLTQIPGLQTPSGYGVAMDFSVVSNAQGNTVVLAASIGADSSNQWYLITDGGGRLSVVSFVAGVSQTSASLPMRTAGLTNRLALSVTPAGIRWTMNGAAVIGVTNAGQPAMTTMAVGRLASSSNNLTNMHATLVSLSPGPQTDAALIARAY